MIHPFTVWYSRRFTEVLRVSDSFSRNFFYILFIRDFLRKRISKSQNLSKCFCSVFPLWLFTKGCIGETKRTGVLRLTAAISWNFFYIILIRDFSRKRTSKEQYPSVIVFFSFLAMAFYEGGYRGKQSTLNF